MRGIKTKAIAALLGISLLASGCGKQTANGTIPSGTGSNLLPGANPQVLENQRLGNSPVPNVRTGIMEQGVVQSDNCFECTDTGAYFLCKTTDPSKVYILYGDHGSDTLVKLCGRPDCTHSDGDCNACVPDADSICYYDGYLYISTMPAGKVQLYRMNLDGSNRVKVMDSSDIDLGYHGTCSPIICNGVLFFGLLKTGDDGAEVCDAFIYRLDGTMEKPAPTESFLVRSDGHNILMLSTPLGQHEDCGDEEFMGLYMVDPVTGELTYLGDTSIEYYPYSGVDADYYVPDGKLRRRDRVTGQEEVLADLGLEGYYQLHAFPDCFALAEGIRWTEYKQGLEPESQTLRFFNWDYEPLGEVTLDYPMTLDPECVICGESEERIMLAANFTGVPEYYIEKSDFGTGHIEVHKYNIPDDIIPEEGW